MSELWLLGPAAGYGHSATQNYRRGAPAALIGLTGPAQPQLGPPHTPAHVPGPHFSSGWGHQSLPQWHHRGAGLQPCFLDGPLECMLQLVSSCVPGLIPFCSWLGPLDGPWPWFITCHVGRCWWTPLSAPSSVPGLSPCRMVPRVP